MASADAEAAVIAVRHRSFSTPVAQVVSGASLEYFAAHIHSIHCLGRIEIRSPRLIPIEGFSHRVGKNGPQTVAAPSAGPFFRAEKRPALGLLDKAMIL